jgi:antitoxin component YwqK of YwqJK toxin-antitoxin module
MNKFAILLIGALTFSYLAEAQNDTLNKTDENGLKQGYWLVKYDNGNTKYEGYFVNDKPSGMLKRYFEDGELKAEMNFISSDSAYSTIYYPNGNKASEGSYVNSKKCGEWKYYSFYNTQLTSIETYNSNAKDGRSLTYYESGSIAEEKNFTNDVQNGIWKQFYESGNLKLSASYDNGILNGQYTVYYDNRLKYVDGRYKQGKMNGDWYYFDENGQIKFKAKYKNGTLLNEDELDDMERDFFKRMDENKGKFNEPTIEDVLPM